MVWSVQKKERSRMPSGAPCRGSCTVDASADDQRSSQATPAAAPAAATPSVAGKARRMRATVERSRELKSSSLRFSSMYATHPAHSASDKRPKVVAAAPPLASSQTALPNASPVPTDAPAKMMGLAPVWSRTSQASASSADETDATAKIVIISAESIASDDDDPLAGGGCGADPSARAATRAPLTSAMVSTPTSCSPKSRAKVTSRYTPEARREGRAPRP
eukprot:scaffold13320_cov118-Isochrysis_galbana.AAC.14